MMSSKLLFVIIVTKHQHAYKITLPIKIVLRFRNYLSSMFCIKSFVLDE